MSRLIETIKLADGRPVNIDYHLNRIRESCQAVFGGLPQWSLGGPLGSYSSGIWKMRIVYDRTGASMSFEQYTIRPIRTLKLIVNDDIVYDHKYEDRNDLQAMFAKRRDCDEVLIIKKGELTDTSYSNILFRKGDKWITPRSYLLNGTMRRYLLDTHQISEQTIGPNDLNQFSHFKLINAMLRDEAAESEVSNIR